MEIYEANRIRKFPEKELPPKEWWYYAYERALKTLRDRKIRARAGSPYKTKQELARAITGWNWWHNMLPETRQFIIDTVAAQRAEGEGGVVTSKGRIPDSVVKKKLGKTAAKRVLKKAKPSKKEIKEARQEIRRAPEISRAEVARRRVAANMRTPDFREIGYAYNPLTRMEVSKLFKEGEKAEEYGDWAASEGHPIDAIGWYQHAYRTYYIARNYLDENMSEERYIPAAAGWPETTETEYPAEHLRELAEEKMAAVTLKIKSQVPLVEAVRSLPYERTPEMRKYRGYFGEQLPGFSPPFETNPSLMMMMGNPEKPKRKKRKSRKNSKKKKTGRKKTTRRRKNPTTVAGTTKKDVEKIKKTKKYKDAMKKYKQFHKGANPVELVPVKVPDGSIADGTVLVGLGTTPEAIYHVPKHSGKQSKIPYKHDYEGTVIKCTDAKGKTIIDLPVGKKKFKVTDWIHG